MIKYTKAKIYKTNIVKNNLFVILFISKTNKPIIFGVGSNLNSFASFLVPADTSEQSKLCPDVFLCLRQKDVIRPLLAPPFRKRSRSTLLLGYCDFLSHLRPSRQYSVPPTFFGLQSISKFFAGISFAAC